MFFKLPILTSNNVVRMPFSAIFFDETQHVVRTSATGYVPVFFFMMSSISLLRFKILCWCFSFVCSRPCIWLSFSSMTCWCSSCIFSMPFLLSHFTKATALDFFRANSNFNCTIQANEDIMRIFCPRKGVGSTDALYFRPGVVMMRWKLLKVISYIPYA